MDTHFAEFKMKRIKYLADLYQRITYFRVPMNASTINIDYELDQIGVIQLDNELSKLY